MLSLLDFTFLSFCPGASLGRGNSFESKLLSGMFYHCLSRQTGDYYYYYENMCFCCSRLVMCNYDTV